MYQYSDGKKAPLREHRCSGNAPCQPGRTNTSGLLCGPPSSLNYDNIVYFCFVFLFIIVVVLMPMSVSQVMLAMVTWGCPSLWGFCVL